MSDRTESRALEDQDTAVALIDLPDASRGSSGKVREIREESTKLADTTTPPTSTRAVFVDWGSDEQGDHAGWYLEGQEVGTCLMAAERGLEPWAGLFSQ